MKGGLELGRFLGPLERLLVVAPPFCSATAGGLRVGRETMTEETVPTLLARLTAGEGAASAPARVDELVPLVYEELRRMARGLLGAERERRTLDTSALVHEAYLKLVGHQEIPERGRAYFFGAAARAMRQVLVEAARRRGRLARGGGERPVPLSQVNPVAASIDPDLLALDEALTRLELVHPRPARVLECRYFGGLSVEETAAALDLSPRTVKRDWSLAQAWLLRELEAQR